MLPVNAMLRDKQSVFRYAVSSEAPEAFIEAQMLSIQLRAALAQVDPRVIEGSDWLRTIHRLLQEGNVFYIVN
jgi:hypothetical protein